MPFHNISKLTFDRHKDDPSHIAANVTNFLKAFSDNAREIFIERFKFPEHILQHELAQVLSRSPIDQLLYLAYASLKKFLTGMDVKLCSIDSNGWEVKMAMEETYRKLRIFVASPSDVASERDKIATVSASLKPLADHMGLALEVMGWRQVVPDIGRPQQVIFDQLQPTTWDVFIGILWHRFGTRPGATNPVTQQAYEAGTEEKFVTAYGLCQQYNRPRIIMYRCMRQVGLDALDPDQYKRVKDFFYTI